MVVEVCCELFIALGRPCPINIEQDGCRVSCCAFIRILRD